MIQKGFQMSKNLEKISYLEALFILKLRYFQKSKY